MTSSRREQVIEVSTINMEEVTIRVLGMTGLYCHRMAAKARQQLLIGGGRKTVAERQQLKHDPYTEFLETLYIASTPYEHTGLQFPAMAFKRAMGTAALEVPGIRKAQVDRLVYIVDEYVPLFGMPKMRLSIMRSADINKTPDVRSRAYLDTWGAEITVRYAIPSLSRSAVITLLANAGIVCGIGDSRPEKGKGNSGTFKVIGDNEEFPPYLLDIGEQQRLMAHPEPFDAETRELLDLYDTESNRRSA